ncbi:hypothetical protein Tco_0843045 [Tanacetum coccineum]|uniref:Uncharacterized protein n=1 Tax=Tanacetum coccineum TaxID=301880 RepID=A0ABQ5B4X6_9ASTR
MRRLLLSLFASISHLNLFARHRSKPKSFHLLLVIPKLGHCIVSTLTVEMLPLLPLPIQTSHSSNTIPVSAAIITDVEITLAQALAELKSAKPKAGKVVIQEPKQGITTTTPTTIIPIPKHPQDKGKGIMIEESVVEQVKPIKRLEQMRLNEELDFKLQAEEEEEEEERLAREKAQQLAQRLQAQEQEKLTDEEKARLFVQFLEQRRKHFAAKRAEKKRNRPPTRAQQRSIMCTYLKNMEGWKPKNLKNKSFANIQELFDKAMKRVNTFVDYRTELVEESSKKAEIELEENLKKAEAEIAQESSSKRARDELEQDNAKKQKVDEDKEIVELQSLMEVVPDEEEVAIDVVPLATKPLTIGDLKTMFEPHVEDQVWKNQDNYSVLDWKLYDSCGVHSLRKQNVYIYMLVEKRYPLTPSTITDMLNKKLQGRIVGIKRLLNGLRVTDAKLMMLVYKLLLLVLKVNAASIKVTTAQRLRLLKEFLLSEKG